MMDIPFDPARPARGDIFIDRKFLKSQNLVSGLLSGKSYSLVGKSGMGKSSLLHAVERRLVEILSKEGQGILPLPLYVQCKRDHRNAADILSLIIENILDEPLLKMLKLSCPASVKESALSEARQERLESAFRIINERLFAEKKRSYRPVLLLDDLHRLNGRESIKRLPSLLYPIVDSQRLSLLLAGTNPLTEELRNDVSPLKSLISQHPQLELFNYNETEQLVKKGAAFTIKRGFAKALFDITSGHPYRLHYYLNGLLLQEGEFTAKGLKRLNTPETEEIINNLLQENNTITQTKAPPLSKSKTITWLHLSDLHFCEPKTGWNAGHIQDKLIEDLKFMEKEYNLTPDLIFFTGDLAFGNVKKEKGWNLKDQFDGAHDFLMKICKAFSREVPKENLFLVPGNHDVDRKIVTEPLIQYLDNVKNDESKITNMIHEADHTWKSYMERLTEYGSFLERYQFNHLLTDRDRLVYAVQREINHVKLGIGGFNSVWSSCRASAEEKGKLRLGAKWQLSTIRSGLKDADLSIVLMHHPPSWFVEEEDKKFQITLQETFNFCLHGHEHIQWPAALEKHITISAGACYNSSHKANGYNLVKLDFADKTGDIYLRKWEDLGAGNWTANRLPGKTDNDGKGRLRLSKARGSIT